MMPLKNLPEALTFDDVLLVPAYSEVVPTTVTTQTQLTREVGVFEIGLVEWTGSQDDGQWVFAIIAVTQQLLAQVAEHAGDPLHLQLADGLRQDLLHYLAMEDLARQINALPD